MLVSHALKHKNVTYFNITPDRPTLPILEAQGYVRYCSGRFVAAPALSASSCRSRVELAAPGIRADEGLQSTEIELLFEHAQYRCISLTCSSTSGRHPFVFLPRWKAGLVPFAYLAYCRHLKDFVQFAGSARAISGRAWFPAGRPRHERPDRRADRQVFRWRPKILQGPGSAASRGHRILRAGNVRFLIEFMISPPRRVCSKPRPHQWF
jgi:hypothetical protein